MITTKGTAAVILATSISIPFVSARLSEKEMVDIEAASAANFSEIKSKQDSQLESNAPMWRSADAVVVDTVITGVPKMDDYPKMKGAYYTGN